MGMLGRGSGPEAEGLDLQGPLAGTGAGGPPTRALRLPPPTATPPGRRVGGQWWSWGRGLTGAGGLDSAGASWSALAPGGAANRAFRVLRRRQHRHHWGTKMGRGCGIWSGGVWTQQGSKLVGTGAVGNAYQGRSVSLSADGSTAIVGGSDDNDSAGAAWVFTRP
jgi:hypothetical protein